MARENILVVEDEEEIQELVRYNLAKEGFSVTCAGSGEEALQKVRRQLPALVVLDLMLPGLDGLEVCKVLKGDAATRDVAVVMLTAKGEEADIVTGLELGADDYITKPFSPRVLIARIRAVLRRRATEPAGETAVIRIHNLVIHPGRHEVTVDDEPVTLTSTEFRVLHVLARRPGWVYTRLQIAEAVHGVDYPVTDRSVDVQIVALRKKLAAAGRYIETVRGVGYKLKE
ncbi:MAG: response regulator transcription factor [Candidatus Nealsonbacteria bacterium]|nr:response regulator transcription factor [Candidatus Nealsonbacteria bacterium]